MSDSATEAARALVERIKIHVRQEALADVNWLLVRHACTTALREAYKQGYMMHNYREKTARTLVEDWLARHLLQGQTYESHIDQLLAFQREAEARTWDEASELFQRHQDANDHDNRPFQTKCRAQATALREVEALADAHMMAEARMSNEKDRVRALTFEILQPFSLVPYGTSDRVEALIAQARAEARAAGLEAAATLVDTICPDSAASDMFRNVLSNACRAHAAKVRAGG